MQRLQVANPGLSISKTRKFVDVLRNIGKLSQQQITQNSIAQRKELLPTTTLPAPKLLKSFSTCLLRFDVFAFNHSLSNQFVQSFSARRFFSKDGKKFYKGIHTKGSEFSKTTDEKNCNEMSPKLAPTVKLNNGCEMPILGLGTYEILDEECVTAVKKAIDIGYRHIDTAYLYQNECAVGQALNAKIQDSTVKRKDIFLVTKLWNTFHEPSKVKYACCKQLKALDVDYIDLYLIHFPVGYKHVGDDVLVPYENDVLQMNDVDFVDTYKAMEELVELGLVRSLGISNFNSEQTQRVLDNCCIKPVTNQVECHPALNQKKLIEFCCERDIIVTAFSPMAFLSSTKSTNSFSDSDESKNIARKYNKTVAQVILRYLLKKSKCLIAIKDAIDLGYRHIDTAFLYRNESFVGQALSEKIQDGTVKREDIFLVTKLWNIFHDPAKVKYACCKQLETLGVDYIDLYLMHSPVGYKYVDDDALMPHDNDVLQTNDIDYMDTYKAMEELVELGIVRSIGLSNFNSVQIQRIMDSCRIKPVANQVECHPGLNQKKLIEFCRERGIIVLAYSPLARPKISKPLPVFYLSDYSKTIAKKYNKTVAQVILRYLSKDNDAEIAVKHAVDVGYRHIDTAYFYQNEDEIGKAINDKIAEGVVKRKDIFLVTKLWNIHHDPSLVESTCRKQLAKLGLDYIDLYLMHLPVGYKYVDEDTLLPKNEDGVLQLSDVDYLDTYKAMEKLVGLGLVRSIGVSNFNSEQLKRVLDNCVIKPVTNQVECSPTLNQKKLTQFCKEHGLTLTAYSPLGRPNPAEKTPEFYYSEKTKLLADKYNKTPAQIILRYLVDIGTIPIPKSSNPQRIEENFNIFDFELTPVDIAIIDEFHTDERLVPFNLIKGQNHKYFPFTIEF